VAAALDGVADVVAGAGTLTGTPADGVVPAAGGSVAANAGVAGAGWPAAGVAAGAEALPVLAAGGALVGEHPIATQHTTKTMNDRLALALFITRTSVRLERWKVGRL